MFNKKQIVRNYIFALFSVLILVISFTLTYYITFYDEEKIIKENLKRKEIDLHNENSCDIINSEFFLNTFIFKLLGAFFAGGVLSDGLYIKLGVF
jgi:uncharacterized membrane protein SpoIIM required for sporulation